MIDQESPDQELPDQPIIDSAAERLKEDSQPLLFGNSEKKSEVTPGVPAGLAQLSLQKGVIKELVNQSNYKLSRLKRTFPNKGTE